MSDESDEIEASDVSYEVDGRLARITLDRPQYRNAQSRRLLEQLDDAFAAAEADHDVRVIILRGAGEHFSSGHDLGTAEELADRQARPYKPGPFGEQKRSWDLNVANTLRWRNIAKPTIAAVHGFCIYGGWMIASAMDLIVAADNARFLPAHFQYFSVPWDLGPRQAKELLWTAEFLDAEQLHELGFVSHVVPVDELDGFTTELAATIARQDPAVAATIKRSVNAMQDAMGFTTAVTTAHAAYMGMHHAGLVVPKGEEGKSRRLPGVARSLDAGT